MNVRNIAQYRNLDMLNRQEIILEKLKYHNPYTNNEFHCKLLDPKKMREVEFTTKILEKKLNLPLS